jgi:hypothetical protein
MNDDDENENMHDYGLLIIDLMNSTKAQLFLISLSLQQRDL